MALLWISLLWGFAEATLFFIIPDVVISIIALRGIEEGLVGALFALVGALLGGAIMYFWGRKDPERLSGIIHRIPAIPAKDIAKVRADLDNAGVKSILFGPFFGIPYKIYAAFAHKITTFQTFILVSIPARGIRFVLVAVLTPLVFGTVFSGLEHTQQIYLLLGAWAVVYVIYFWIKRA